MLAGLLALVIVIAQLFPDTPLGRWLHLYLVELPLRLAHRIERKHIILLLFVLFAGQTLALVGSMDLALIYAAEMSAYYDVMLTASLAAAASRLKAAWVTVRTAFARLAGSVGRPHARAPRRSRPARPGKPCNDDEPGRDLLRAA